MRPGTLVLASLGLLGCSLNDNAHLQASDGGLDFQVGAVAFHLADAGTRTSGAVLRLFFTDQPDVCAASASAPVQPAVFLIVDLQPELDGTTRARVAPMRTTSAPGLAVGRLTRQAAGVESDGYALTDGNVAWTAVSARLTTLDALDLGFAAAAGRVHLDHLDLRSCN